MGGLVWDRSRTELFWRFVVAGVDCFFLPVFSLTGFGLPTGCSYCTRMEMWIAKKLHIHIYAMVTEGEMKYKKKERATLAVCSFFLSRLNKLVSALPSLMTCDVYSRLQGEDYLSSFVHVSTHPCDRCIVGSLPRLL